MKTILLILGVLLGMFFVPLIIIHVYMRLEDYWAGLRKEMDDG